MKVKADLETIVKERNEALFSYDERKIKAYMRKYGLRVSTNDIAFWGQSTKPSAISQRRRPSWSQKRKSGWRSTECQRSHDNDDKGDVMKHFKRKECALCGRKSTMRFVHARLATGLATVPHRKVRLCMIDCRHCGKGVMEVGASKEAAKAEAVKRWNANQGRNLLAMERFLRKIFAGGNANE